MKKLITLIYLSVLLMLSATVTYSQTKKERKMKTTGLETGMYNSSESKEAMEYYSKAYDYEKKEDYKNAVKWYKKTIEADSMFVEAYDNMGAAYRRSGDLENAKKCYFKSIELYPEGRMAHMNLGVVYGIEKKYEMAIEQYEIMQKNDSTDPEGYYGPINIYISMNDFKSAIKSASKTLEIYEATSSPYLADAQYWLGYGYYMDGNKKNAKVYLEQAKKSGATIPDKILKDLDIQ
jgi:tetratricopeptide (TPR) repeat protein